MLKTFATRNREPSMLKKRILEDRGVVRTTFELPAEVKGDTAHLVGDFTSWKGIPMERLGDGRWQTTVDLEPGRSFEFRYLIDGAWWENDWAADRYVRNPFGHENSVIETPGLESMQDPAEGAAGRAASARGGAPQRRGAAKSGARGSAAKKTAAKQSAAKKTAAKKTAAKKSAAKKSAAKETAGKRPAAGRAAEEPIGDNAAGRGEGETG